jgi:anthranilate phosphoribosyltransferase
LSGAIQDAKRDVVLLNAGAALLTAGKVDDLLDGIEMAAQTIDSGAALDKLNALVEFTQRTAVLQ